MIIMEARALGGSTVCRQDYSRFYSLSLTSVTVLNVFSKTVEIQHYIYLKCTTQWLDIYFYYFCYKVVPARNNDGKQTLEPRSFRIRLSSSFVLFFTVPSNHTDFEEKHGLQVLICRISSTYSSQTRLFSVPGIQFSILTVYKSQPETVRVSSLKR